MDHGLMLSVKLDNAWFVMPDVIRHPATFRLPVGAVEEKRITSLDTGFPACRQAWRRYDNARTPSVDEAFTEGEFNLPVIVENPI